MAIRRPVRTCLVGIGGYGRTHLAGIAELEKEGLVELRAVVVRNPAKYAADIAELESRGVECFSDYHQALERRPFDFIILSTPLQMHRQQVIEALEAGLPVLCEKSAAPTVQDVQAMIEVQEKTGLPVEIAYQTLTGSALRAIQRAVIDGCVGRVRHVIVRGAWRRTDCYYQRSAWAGRVQVDGLWTLDGPINNPMAHFFYNGMYLASSEPGRLARPIRVRGELYRARPTIEGEDTACIEVAFDNDVTEYFYTTLVTTNQKYSAPRLDVYGELGRVTWLRGHSESPIQVERHDGQTVEIEHDGIGGTTIFNLRNFACYLLGESDFLYSPVSESLKFSRASNGAFDSSRKVHPIPEACVEKAEVLVGKDSWIGVSPTEMTVEYNLKGIVEIIDRAAEERALFSDIGVPWAVATEPVDVTDYHTFPQAYEPRLLP